VKKRFALVIGAPCAGTTALFRLLGSHPQVISCRVKEPRFFTDDRKWALGIDWYRSLWDFREPDKRIAVEASSDYAWHPRVPSPALRIAQTPAGFRFLYLLRHPLERIVAQHAADLAEGRVEGALDAHRLEFHLDASRYAAQLEAYRRHFPQEDFLLLSAELLAQEPRSVLERVCCFLEIDPYFGFPEVESLRAGEAAQRGARRRPQTGWRESLMAPLRRAGSHRPAASAPPPVLPEALRAAALQVLRDDLVRLGEEWGFDVSAWGLDT
jgi:hypothetical protein